MPEAQPTTTGTFGGNSANTKRNACTDAMEGAREPENPTVDDSSKWNIETLSEVNKQAVVAVKVKVSIDVIADQCYTALRYTFCLSDKTRPGSLA
jgi:hypothetical protein